MKTLHLTNAWHETSGGVSTFYRALMRAAERAGDDICLVVPSETTRVEQVSQHARIYHVRSPHAPLNHKYRIMLPHHFLVPGGLGNRILREERPDVVEVCDKYSLHFVAALLLRGSLPGINFRPAVVGLSCERFDLGVRAYVADSVLAQRVAQWYMKWFYFRFFHYHITVSEFTSRELRQASYGHKLRRGVWIRPMGVDVALFTPQRRSSEIRSLLLTEAGCSKDTMLLLYAGRIVPEKNLGLLIGMMERLTENSTRNVHLLIAGDGVQLPQFQRDCENRIPGHVTFLGHIAGRERLADLYANVDLFVHPNPNEPFGIGPLEAMASGTGLVGPNSGGTTAYANESNSWLAAASGPEFAGAVLQAVSDPAEFARRVKAARETAELYDWDHATDQFLALYRELHALTTGVKRISALPPDFTSHPATGWKWRFGLYDEKNRDGSNGSSIGIDRVRGNPAP